MRLWPLLLLLGLASTCAAQAPQVLHTVDLLESGDALWTFERRYALESPLDERAWNATASNLTESHPGFRQLVGGLRESVAAGARAAGRPMEARNFTLEVRRERFGGAETGVVSVRFEWRGLVGPEGRFGDAFPDGIPLGPRDALVLRPPPGLSPTYVYPPADLSREVEIASDPRVPLGETGSGPRRFELVWLGPRNLGAGEPFVRLERPSTGTGLLAGSALGAAGAAAALLAGWNHRRARRPAFEVDEGVVLKVVEEAGELPQGSIIERTGWSKARVSKVLSALERRGWVEKVRRGRENLVRFKGRKR